MPNPIETTAGLAAAAERPNIFVVPQLGRGSNAPDDARSHSHGRLCFERSRARPDAAHTASWRLGSSQRVATQSAPAALSWAGVARVAVAAVGAGALVTLIGLGSGRPAERPPRPAIVPTDLPAASVAEPAVLPRHSHPRRPRVQRERRTRRVRRHVPRRQPVPAVASRQPSAPRTAAAYGRTRCPLAPPRPHRRFRRGCRRGRHPSSSDLTAEVFDARLPYSSLRAVPDHRGRSARSSRR